MTPEVTISLCLLIALTLGFWGLYVWSEGNQENRLSRKHGAPAVDTDPWVERAHRAVDRWAARSKVGTSLERRLRRGGVSTPLADVLVGSAAAVVLGALIAWWALGLLAGIIAAAAVVRILFSVLAWLTARRRDQFIGQMPQIARLLANGSSAGLSVRRSVIAACEELNEPARGELKIVADSLAIGVPLETALHELGERLPSRELSVLVNTLVVQMRSGGGVVTALQRMAMTLDSRKKLREEMKSILGGTTYAAYLLPVMALLGVIAVTGGDRDTLRLYFTTGIGQLSLVISGAFIGLGIVLMRRSVSRVLR